MARGTKTPPRSVRLPMHAADEPARGGAERIERADAARNRVRILAAARKLLARRTIGEVCMDELARAAGVGKGTLYRRFVDRASLCLALLDENERDLQEAALRGFGLGAQATARARLFALAGGLFDFAWDNAPLLAEAEAFHRGTTSRFESPPYAWRRRALGRAIAAARREAGDAGGGDPTFTADFLLAGLAADLLGWHARGVAQHAEGKPAIESARVALRVAYLGTVARVAGVAPPDGPVARGTPPV